MFIVVLIFPDSFSVLPSQVKSFEPDYPSMLSGQIAILLATFSSVYFVHKVIDREKPSYLKSMLNLRGILNGISLGVVLILVCILVLTLVDPIEIKYQGFQIGILYYFIIFIIVAILEEVLARGFILNNLYYKQNKYIAIIISSLLFSLMHILNTAIDITGIINLFLIGVLFALLYLKNMNLSFPIGLHFSWNFVQGPIFGFNVSGNTNPSIFNVQSISGDQFSFEGFGLEGSIIVSFILGTAILYFWISQKKQKQIDTQLASI
jgi:uncharacterized protein